MAESDQISRFAAWQLSVQLERAGFDLSTASIEAAPVAAAAAIIDRPAPSHASAVRRLFDRVAPRHR